MPLPNIPTPISARTMPTSGELYNYIRPPITINNPKNIRPILNSLFEEAIATWYDC